MIKINGVAIATPKTFEVIISDYDSNSERNASGQLIRDRIAVKRKINLEWAPLTQDQSSILLQAVNDVFFTVEFPDPQLGIISRTMYVGDRTAPAYAIVDGQAKWSGIKMNFVER